MATTSQPTTFSELYTGLLNRVRASPGVTAQDTEAKRFINTALHDMHINFNEKVPWATRTATLITQPDYTTGTVTITQGSTTLTGASTVWTTANAFGIANARAGGKVQIDGGREIYEVSSVDSATQITLASKFVKADVSAADYVYFEDEYALAVDFLRPVSFKFFDRSRTVELIDRDKFSRFYTVRRTVGRPVACTIWDKPFSGSTTPVRKIVFDKPPDDAYMFEYDYITKYLAVTSSGTAQESLVNDTDEPIVPLRYRHALIFHALAHWYRDKRDDNRAQVAKAEYVDLMTRIAGDSEIGQNRARIQPIRGPYVRAAQRPYSGRAGRRYVTGTAFDELKE